MFFVVVQQWPKTSHLLFLAGIIKFVLFSLFQLIFGNHERIFISLRLLVHWWTDLVLFLFALHFHGEREDTPFILALRKGRNRAIIHLDEIFTDHKPHANALAIHLSSSSQFTEQREQFVHFVGFDTFTFISHPHF